MKEFSYMVIECILLSFLAIELFPKSLITIHELV
jgi:hypothetical protein